jgi:hypothetical protein
MNDGHVLDELSAYIDGEAQDPARVARHLQFCEPCARRHIEILKLSANLRGMPRPEAQPEFVMRVIERISKEPAAPARPNVLRVVFARPYLAAAALLVVVAAWSLTQWLEVRPVSAPPAISPMATVPEEVLLNEFERRISQGDDLSDWAGTEEEGAEAMVEDVPLELVLEFLADASADEEEPDGLDAGDSLSGIFETMDQEESEAFRQVLREYVDELTRNGSQRG